MTAQVIAPDEATVLDLATDKDRIAHLACGLEFDHPDEPMHALCGHPLVGVDAPHGAPRCADCNHRMRASGGGLAALLGMLRCDQHPAQP